MMKQVLEGRLLITAEDTIDYPRITIDHEGRIESIEAGEPNGSEDTLAPAFLDIHVHGAAGRDAMEGTADALRGMGTFLATRGVARFLATTVTAPVDPTLRALEGLANIIERDDDGNETLAARPIGIHLEGPFISHAKRGVHPTADIQPPSIPLFERMRQAARGHIKLMTVAPEMGGAIELIEYATGVGTHVSVGHSDATAEQTRAAIAAGASSATHTFNAMRRLDHREPGIAGVTLDAEDLYAELICDGIHVAPEFVRLWMLSKSGDRGILITDGISATGQPEGNYLLGGLEVTVRDGRCLLASDLKNGIETLAGSILTLDRAVENLQRFTGVDLATAVRLASRNPAQMLALENVGEIAVGQPASLNLFGPDRRLRSTFLRGRAVTMH